MPTFSCDDVSVQQKPLAYLSHFLLTCHKGYTSLHSFIFWLCTSVLHTPREEPIAFGYQSVTDEGAKMVQVLVHDKGRTAKHTPRGVQLG